MLLAELVETSRAVSETRSRSEKIARLATTLGRLSPEEIRSGVSFLAGELPDGRVGVGYATVFGTESSASASAFLAVLDLERSIHDLASASGTRAKQEILGALLARATHLEQQFIRRLLVGELRQGALAGVVTDAIAQAASVDAGLVRRATMLRGHLGDVARAALTGGASALETFKLELMRPVQPMLAQTAADVDDALAAMGEAALEYKLDGARLQAHKSSDQVRVFSREGNEITTAVPEVVELVQAVPANRLVIEGEALVLRADGRPEPFQVSMRRLGRKLEAAALRKQLPLSPYFFDLLHLDGHDLIDRSWRERVTELDRLVPGTARLPRLVTSSVEAADAFYAEALAAGHEGVMAKDPGASYEAGRRGKSWLKLKPAHTLDLVVLAAEWGNGRRQGWLSNLHLGARDPENNGFVMLGKTFKGMTDALLAWQTEQLLQREIGRDGVTVHVKPELVVEIAFDSVQDSPIYPGGLALRFARVKAYRPDKSASEADTIKTVRAIRAGTTRHA
jgi:DNA ligase 1